MAALTLSFSKVSDFLSSAVPLLVTGSAEGNPPVLAPLTNQWVKKHREYYHKSLLRATPEYLSEKWCSQRPAQRRQLQIQHLQPDMQDLDPRTGDLVPFVAALALRITGSGPHGSESTSSLGSDGRPPLASPVLMDPAPYAFPDWAEDPQGGFWHCAEEKELSNDLGQRAFHMRSATFETVNVQQQWQELEALAAHYRGFAAESATVQQKTGTS